MISPILLSGRPRKNIPTVDWKIVVPADVAVLVEEALPARGGGKAQYGARSQLIELLLRRWLQEQDPLHTNVNVEAMEAVDSPSPASEGEETTAAASASPPPTFRNEGI